MMGGYSGMMNGYGFGSMNFFGFGLLGWFIELLVIGVVVYFTTKLALKNYNKEQQNR